MSGRQSIRSVRGMNDLLPEQAGYWQWFEQSARELLSEYGYREIRTPIVEKTELFARSIGEVTDIVEKEMYTFEDRNGDSLTLRPENTASCVRAGIEHGFLHNRVSRLWYMGPMFRHERPQKGRYRQFHQLGAEVFGVAGADADAELILMTARFLGRLGLTDIQLELNSLGTPESRAAHREQLVAYLYAHESDLDDDSRRRLDTNPLRVLDSKNPVMQPLIERAPRLNDYLDPESREHFAALCEILDRAGISYMLNHRLVRGLDYYTKTVFEWTTNQLGAQGTVCGGGRYDGLVSQIGGPATPGVGFSMGIERLVELLIVNNHEAPEDSRDVYLIASGSGTQAAALALSEKLRDDCPGLKMHLDVGDGGFRAKMRRADRSGAVFALILGADELSAETIIIKPLRERSEQVAVPWNALRAELAQRLGAE